MKGWEVVQEIKYGLSRGHCGCLELSIRNFE